MQDEDPLDELLIKRIRELTTPQTPLPTDQKPQLQQLDSIKSVVFDVYGTMFVSSSGDIGLMEEHSDDEQAFYQGLESLDVDFKEWETAQEGVKQFRQVINDTHKRMKTEGIPHPEVDIVHIWHEVFRMLSEKGLLTYVDDFDFLKKFSVEFEIRFNPPWPMPGLQETLSQFRDQNYKLGIVSNSQFYTPLSIRALMNQSLEELGFYPDLLQWSYKNSMGKPSIGLYELLVETLRDAYEINPDEVLYIGNDMLNDVYPAHELGMKTALFAGDQRSLRLREGHPECQQLRPDLVITELPQILECV